MRASGGDEIDSDADLAESLHRVLATLIKVRNGHALLSADVLRERLELVQWLRRELTAVETLLAGQYEHVQREGQPVPASAAPPGTPAVR